MKIINDVIAILNFTFLTLSFVFVVFFLTTGKGNKRTNRSIAFFIFSIILCNSFYIAIKTQCYIYFPFSLSINKFALLLLGPSFYLYIKSQVIPEYMKIKISNILHLVPFFLYLLISLPESFNDSSIYKFYLDKGEYPPDGITFFQYIFPVISLHIIFYMFLSAYEIRKNKEHYLNCNSDLEEWKFAWVKKAIIEFVVITGFCISVFILFDYEHNIGDITGMLPITSIYAAYQVSMAWWKNINSKRQIPDISEVITYKNTSNNKKPKYMIYETANDITEDSYKLVLNKIESEKLFTDNNFTLTKLSLKLNISRNRLSFIINKYSGRNFFDFINSYRIEEAKKILMNTASKKLNIINIANKSGFKSKSSFNRIFKRSTNLTPSNFRKKYCKKL